jgi:hypothetical protein
MSGRCGKSPAGEKLRAAPTPKWESIATPNDAQIAQGSRLTRSGATGMNAPNAVAMPVTHASRIGVLDASPILSSSRTFSSSARTGSAITDAASAPA